MIGNAGLLMIENKTRSPFVLFNAKNAIEYTTTKATNKSNQISKPREGRCVLDRQRRAFDRAASSRHAAWSHCAPEWSWARPWRMSAGALDCRARPACRRTTSTSARSVSDCISSAPPRAACVWCRWCRRTSRRTQLCPWTRRASMSSRRWRSRLRQCSPTARTCSPQCRSTRSILACSSSYTLSNVAIIHRESMYISI